MRATNLARVVEAVSEVAVGDARAAAPIIVPDGGAAVCCSPALRVVPLLTDTHTRRFVRVPTHAVGVHPEHREYPRATLRLPLRLRSVNSIAEKFPITLVTRDISSTGVFFLCPKRLELDTQIEIEIVLVSRPLGRGNVVVATTARVRRLEPAAMPRWYGVAALFDEMSFGRDDRVPTRFMGF
jgi:hypothetical protein